MSKELKGKIVKGLGGLYETRCADGDDVTRIACRAKGTLKRGDEKLLIGDNVLITVDEDTPDGVVISELLPRKNALIRPPMANLDILFLVFSAKKPCPQLETVDKLTAIAEHNSIEPVIVITKTDLDAAYAEELYGVYSGAGFATFVTSSFDSIGLAELKAFVRERVRGGVTAAFAGASGVGKSTLLNALFPELALATGEISRKIERGKHTTRHVEIFEVGEGSSAGFLADTPGFSLIDFERFDFFEVEDLLPSFRDILPHASGCRYQDCAHVGESKEECAVARAADEGLIATSRLESYRSIYRVLKNKNKYE
ncbi:MAG: ribosome small subunit-dependent GTPase A [Clostridia bacterium]|nr:ribosome small subunit-dependent GTPase A [Clostridia bacterium]